MERNDLSERLIAFSARVIRLLDYLPSTKAAREIEGQLIRSAMGVGSNYSEAKGADTRADFCHKMQIALKEMRETHYWLSVISHAELLSNPKIIVPILDEATQLRAIFGKSVAVARGRSKSEGRL